MNSKTTDSKNNGSEKQKRTFYTELSYILGLTVIATGVALMEKADMGMSMVVAPAYILHLKVSQYLPWFSFGTAEYVFQAFVIVLLCIVMGKGKKSYLFSFVTAVIYGMILDAAIFLLRDAAASSFAARLGFYAAGIMVCAIGVSLVFHTYIAPEAYELFVKEVSAKTGYRIDKVKTVYDCCSCLLGVMMSFAFFGFGHFEGVKLGTVFCALVNGSLIGRWNLFFENRFEFIDALNLRHLFDR